MPSKTASPFHPRNRHQGRYDFPKLIQHCPELGRFVVQNPYGKTSIDFADPQAVRVLNRALLTLQYGIRQWSIPQGYLCPPIPGRADYLHGLADLVAEDLGQLPRGAAIRVLDIGCGANCIYPLLGQADYGWRFVGCDIDGKALSNAQNIVHSNDLQQAIELRQQNNPQHFFAGVVQPAERFALSLCNPPFHSSAQEAAAGSRRKWKNLGKQDPSRKLPALNFGGHSNELWCAGGELGFVRRMMEESQAFASQFVWFSCLISKGGNLPLLERTLKQIKAQHWRICTMQQGQKTSRFIAWSFADTEQRRTALADLFKEP